MPSPFAIIVNATSGVAGEPVPKDLPEILHDSGIDAEVMVCHRGEQIVDVANRAVKEGYRTVVAGGGDGTVNAIACRLIDSDVVLGVLPLGTLNHFAKDLGLPTDLRQAVQVLARGNVVSIDVGEVNGTFFINNSSLGLYPSIVRQREEHQRLGRGKWHAFVRAFWTILGRYPLLKVHITIDGNELVRKTPIVFIGNNEYEIHGLSLGTRARMDRGELSLYVTRDVGRLGLVRLAARALVGRLRDDQDFDAFSARELWIETRRGSVPVATDGEVAPMRPPLRYRIRPGALRVLAPA